MKDDEDEMNNQRSLADDVIDNAEMLLKRDADKLAQISAKFFISSPTDTVDKDALEALNDRRSASKREVRLLRSVCKALNAMTPRGRWAAIRWLVDAYKVGNEAPPDDANAKVQHVR